MITKYFYQTNIGDLYIASYNLDIRIVFIGDKCADNYIVY